MTSWTTIEISKLREIYPTENGVKKCAELFGRSKKSVTLTAFRNGIKSFQNRSELVSIKVRIDKNQVQKFNELGGSTWLRGLIK